MILPFELDPQIIHHIIYSQAGSIGKAIIELLMNSVDANAKSVQLTLDKEGFVCMDDGRGFANKEDVLQYFGRFGTPHEEGDATYGRFRLGRGQIMAHASTVWQSNDFQMTVDTRSMGYNYDLEIVASPVSGCSIQGTWYDRLNESELMSVIQEIRDLVRYTPISVALNNRIITRNPSEEKWDFEDDFAFYRVKEDGAVSIYNQGVLVRHDASHIWGAGGLIVSKKAIGLNVSRTEILRKTCPVWKVISKQFGKMADEMASRLGEHRKTEARREKSARALLSGDENILRIFDKEEVITIMPGKRHISLIDFLYKSENRFDNKITVVEDSFDVTKGETIAAQGIALVVHPQTLQRFGCYNPQDFAECIERILASVQENVKGKEGYYSRYDRFVVPELIQFSTLRDALVERMHIVSEKDKLDKETRRAWTALRWCLQQYAGACLNVPRSRNGRLYFSEPHMQILLGDSNTAEAWTDGRSYIAIDQKHVIKLKKEPLRAAAYIFSLVEHEVSHEGDSIDAVHDEAFYRRYHDISIRMSSERQRYMHIWLTKYTTSMQNEGKSTSGNAWRERFLVDRAGSGRQKRGLTAMIEDVSQHPLVITPVPAENVEFIRLINEQLKKAGHDPEQPDWNQVLERARKDQLERLKGNSENPKMTIEEFDDFLESEFERIAGILGITIQEIDINVLLNFLMGESDETVIELWESKPWDQDDEDFYFDFDEEFEDEYELADNEEHDVPQPEPGQIDARDAIDPQHHHLIIPGETIWSLQRNAAAAGFYNEVEYLQWRAQQ